MDATLSEGEYSEEELGSLAVNLGSLHQRKENSDTENDFLDKDDATRRNLKNKLKELEEELDNALEDGEEEKEAVNNMADDEYSICGSEAGGDDKATRNRSVKVKTYFPPSQRYSIKLFGFLVVEVLGCVIND